MKSFTATLLIAALACTGAKAEIFSPSSLNGAIWGAAAGAIIGHNSGDLHHNGWRGAAIGAGTGLLLGSLVDDHGGPRYYRSSQVPVPTGYYGNRYVYRPVYGGIRPSYAVRGSLLGGITGAIIGHNSRHGGWRGAAVGAGAGLLLGAIADSAASREEVVEYYEPQYTPQAPAPARETAAPQNVTIINNYYASPSTPMSSANSLFGR